MSNIVILSAQLAAPHILGDLLAKVAAQDQILAEWIKGLDTFPIIEECVQNALARLGKIEGIKQCQDILDYYGKAYGGKLAGALKTDALPNGLGVKINEKGAIEFVADEYQSEWKSEIKRLQKLFTDAFQAEATTAILQILGYEVEVESTTTEKGELIFNLEGVKQ